MLRTLRLSQRAPAAMESLLYGPPRLAQAPARRWTAADFRDVNDTVRGGSSRSSVRIVQEALKTGKGKEKESQYSDDGAGELVFEGFLDTTTLGGAGFASQLCEGAFPWKVRSGAFRGLALRYRVPMAANPNAPTAEKQPGGGKAPVTAYTVQLKTSVPEHRPDGRRESVVTYEWEFDVGSSSDTEKGSRAGDVVRVTADWAQFKPTYRGRPKDDAEPLDPAKVTEWSIMARSNFAAQSGAFALQIATLSAVHASASLATVNGAAEGDADIPLDRTSGEYYGFALFIFATVVWALWSAWALLPDSALQWLGIAWYPNREWAYLIPAWSLVTVLLTYIGFMALNLYRTPPADDLRTITDSHANVLAQPGALAGMRLSETGLEKGPLAAGIYDLPLGMVSRELYLNPPL